MGAGDGHDGGQVAQQAGQVGAAVGGHARGSVTTGQQVRPGAVQGNKVFARPTGTLPEGRYRIAWRVVSSDGHPIQGELAFTITAPEPSSSPSEETPTPASSPEPQPASAQSPASAQPPASAQSPASARPPSSSQAAATRVDGTSGLPGWLWAALVVVLAGGAAVLFAARRKPRPGRG
ncbi:copper resistance protein CopC [Nonomuraea jabiensis]|uniref:copper resistance protein CopC n=1 Tax=Nonomuraea jabiensis TaxID=882448 RepID=UPI003F4DE8A6